MKVAVGADHGGYELKEKIKDFLREKGYEVVDFGTNSDASVDYPEIAYPLAKAVAEGKCERGILICGTGIGMSLVANKVKGVRAALCSDVYSARYSVLHNNANVLTFGGRVIGEGLAKEIVNAWLSESFSKEERHVRRVNKIKEIEERWCKDEL